MLRKIKTFSQSLVLGTAFAALLPLWAYASNPEDISSQSLALAGQENHSAAITLIAAQPDEIRNSYDVRFAKARILAWAGDYQASAAAYDALMSDFPGNPDIQNGYGYLEYYRGNLDAAENHFSSVLASYPGYQDARDGLGRVAAARADEKANDYRWRIDLNAGLSSFDNDQQDWNNQSVRVEHVPGSIAFYGSAARFERFGSDDIQLMAGARSNNDADWDWELGAGITPSADFRAELTGLARMGYKYELDGGTVLHGSLGYQIDDYQATGTVHQITPQVIAYLENGMVLSARLIHVMQGGESSQTGFLASGLTPVTNRLNARAGYANAPEAINGIVIDTESLFGGLSFRINENLEVHGTYTRDNRENIYIRDGFNVGLTQKY